MFNLANTSVSWGPIAYIYYNYYYFILKKNYLLYYQQLVLLLKLFIEIVYVALYPLL